MKSYCKALFSAVYKGKVIYWLAPIVYFLVFVSLGLAARFFADPGGIHFIRQTDSLSFVAGYIHNGYDFFHPQTLNLESIQGRAASEFPVIYYLTAVLLFFTAKNFFVLKLINLLVVYSGIFYFFRTGELLLKNTPAAFAISLIPFTSTVFNYYSFNYLPDTAALGFTFSALYFAFSYLHSSRPLHLIKAALLFALAGLIKVTAFIYPLAFAFLALGALVFKRAAIIERAQAVKLLQAMAVAALVVVSWNIYAFGYNHWYNSHYFLSTVLPIWTLSREEIAGVIDLMTNYWKTEYLAIPSMGVTGLLVVSTIIFFDRLPGWFRWLLPIVFSGGTAYFLLFFLQFRQHDYYTLNLLPILMLIVLAGMRVLLQLDLPYKKIARNAGLFLLFVVVMYGVNYSARQLDNRFCRHTDSFSRFSHRVAGARAAILALSSSPNDRFIMVPDPTPNGSLLMINRMGWNLRSAEEATPQKIHSLREKGAAFLVADTTVDIKPLGGTVRLKERGIVVVDLR